MPVSGEVMRQKMKQSRLLGVFAIFLLMCGCAAPEPEIVLKQYPPATCWNKSPDAAGGRSAGIIEYPRDKADNGYWNVRAEDQMRSTCGGSFVVVRRDNGTDTETDAFGGIYPESVTVIKFYCVPNP
jgi:hypothetical protein